ncbi:MerR family transcriptional regulator [Pseudonocardia humida]|uniref:MerR family transcriptional regulator n=1 Tax=Pseudonocardia humida TaxID=2800819 RepID=A0ABT1AA54_9PSEU|nr:MerR family transcriptional regulator [Pseudonocardia humida]MCO1659823.1 MerR family transcriptional regulator [Pseudonocardia humida]
MAWSTRQLAELAGTSPRAVRHYHEVGLLPEPERRSNGYKQYGVSHLVRLLRIKRLTELGFSLPRIADMGEADEHPAEALRSLDAELAATIERLQRARAELGVILRGSLPTDLPADIGPAAAGADLSAADRSFVVVMTRVLGPRGLDTYRELLQDPAPDPDLAAFDDLPADADEPTRAELADRMAPAVRALHARHPGLRDIDADAPGGAASTARTIGTAIRELYNPAQIDVLVRVERQLRTR